MAACFGLLARLVLARPRADDPILLAGNGLKGLSEPAKRGEWMCRVVNRTESEGQTSADRSPSTLTPLPRATHPGAPGPTWNQVSYQRQKSAGTGQRRCFMSRFARLVWAVGAVCWTLCVGCGGSVEAPQDYTHSSPRLRVIQTGPLTLDRIYKSMSGPMHRVDVDVSDLDWITGFRTNVVDAVNGEEMGGEFFCHSQLQIQEGMRLTVMATGLQEMRFPPGFGVPTSTILAKVPPASFRLNFLGMLLNNHVPDIDRQARIRGRIEYLTNEDLDGPLRRLYMGQAAMWVRDLDEYTLPEGQPANPDVSTHCAYVADMPYHWWVPPGPQKTRVKLNLQIPTVSTVHYIATHMHNYGEYVRLTDTVTGEILWQADVEYEPQRKQIAHIPIYSSEEGFRVYPGRNYELEAYCDNTTDRDVDSMAVMYFYFNPEDNSIVGQAPSKSGRGGQRASEQ